MKFFLTAIALMLATLAAPAASADPGAFVDCTKPLFLKAADFDPAFQCTEIARETVSVGGHSVSLRTLQDGRTNPQYVANHAALVMEAAKSSLQTFQGLGFGWDYANISLVMLDPTLPEGGFHTPHEQFRNVLADARPDAFASDCIVRFSISRLDQGAYTDDVLKDIQWVTAHEVFHCIQGWNYAGQYRESARSWWVEGTANLFAGHAFDAVEHMKNDALGFTAAITTKPLTQLSYVSSYFFAWLWNKNPQDVIDLMAAMPTSGGEAAHQAALDKLLGDRLGQFARDAVDGQIKDVKGNSLPPLQVTRTEEFTETRPITVTETPFVMNAAALKFKDGTYGVSADRQHELYHLDVMAEGGEWESGFFWSEGGCGVTKTYYLVGMRTKPGAQDVTMTAERMPGTCESCWVDDARDACVVGTWEIDKDSLAEAILLDMDTKLEQVNVAGKAVVEILNTGRHRMGFNMLTIQGRSAGDNTGAGDFRIYIAGLIESDWGTRDGVMRTCYRESEAAIQFTTRGATSEVMTFDDLVQAVGSKVQTYRYECKNPNEVIVSVKSGDDIISIRLNRIK